MSLFVRYVKHYFRFFFRHDFPSTSPVLPYLPGYNMRSSQLIGNCLACPCGVFSLSRRLIFSMQRKSKYSLLAASLFLGGLPAQLLAQNPPPPKKLPAGPPSPQSKHYPILLLAFGNAPTWSLRIGQKGPERLDRPGYPPIPLEAAEVTHEAAADSWTYHAKDSGTGAAASIHLTPEASPAPLTDTLTTPGHLGGKTSFRP